MTPHVSAAAQAHHVRSLPAAPPALDLDAQIEQLEQRLVARESWVQFSAHTLAERTQQALAPPSWLLPAVGVGAVLWLGSRLLRRRAPARSARAEFPASTAVPRPESLIADLPWAGMLALGWPLLPAAWRARVSPATATAVLSTGLSIVRRLLGRSSH